MNAQVEFCMYNHEETCLNPKWSQFHEFWMKNSNASHGWVCRCHGVFNEEKFDFDEMNFELS